MRDAKTNLTPDSPLAARLQIRFASALPLWLVTAAILTVLLGFVVPDYLRGLRENLATAAKGTEVAFRTVAARDAVHEDFSQVIEFGMEILKGDPPVNFLAVARNEGWMLIHDRDGWRTALAPGEDWRPQMREPVGRINVTSLLNRRVFHYSQPFDVSDIPWGWIHVRHSLERYDREARQSYLHVTLVAIVGITLSLLASIRKRSVGI